MPLPTPPTPTHPPTPTPHPPTHTPYSPTLPHPIPLLGPPQDAHPPQDPPETHLETFPETPPIVSATQKGNLAILYRQIFQSRTRKETHSAIGIFVVDAFQFGVYLE